MDPPKLFNALISELAPEKRVKSVPFLVDSLDYNKKLTLYNTKDLKSIITFINSSLNDLSSRIEGLNILNIIIEQCSTETFSENHVQWIQSLKKVVMTDACETSRILSADILNRIFTHASEFPEFLRNLVTSAVIPQFIQNVTGTFTTNDEEYGLSTVKLIESFLKFFPGSCRQNVNVLKKKILVLLVSDNRDVVELSASALAMIPYVGGAGGAKMDREANWTTFYAQLLGSIHQILNVLYKKVEKPDNKVDPVEHFLVEYKEVVGNSVEVHLSRCRRIIGFLVTVRKMLSTDGRDPRLFLTVPIENTLLLACRVLNVNGEVFIDAVRHNQSQIIILMSFIPILHNETLKVLIDLLMVCRRHMSLHSTLILQIIQQCLNGTSSNNQIFEYGHPMANLRVSVYELFVTWFELVQSPAGGLKNFELLFVNQMLSDVIPQAQSVILDPGSGKSKSGSTKSKKAKRDFGSISSVDVIHRKNTPWANCELCEAALKALKVLFYYGAEDLRTRSLNTVHNAVLKLSFDIQTLVDVPNPYKDSRCRTAVYKLLLATVLPQHPNYVPELSTSIEIFSKGVMDCNREVSETCVEALAVCQTMTNPRRRPMIYLTSGQMNKDSDSEFDDDDDPTVLPVSMEEDAENEKKEEGHKNKEDNDKVQEYAAMNGFPKNNEEVAADVVINGQAESSEMINEELAGGDGYDDDDIQLLEYPGLENDCDQDEPPQFIAPKMDVDSDSDELKIIENLQPMATGCDEESSKKSSPPPPPRNETSSPRVETSPHIDTNAPKEVMDDSKGTEDILMTFVDAQPDVD